MLIDAPHQPTDLDLVRKRGLGPSRPSEWELIVPALEARAERDSGRLAVSQGQTRLTYAELHADANRLARYLKRCGIGRGDRVAILLPRGVDAVVAILAALKAGATYLPVDLSYPPARIQFVLADAGVRAALTTTDQAAFLPAEIGRVLLDEAREAIAREPADPLPLEAQPGDAIYVIYTSGSTGQPKGAAVSQRSFANLMQWYVNQLALSEVDGLLLLSALGFDLTQKNLFAPLLVGGALHLPSSTTYDPNALASAIEERAVTVVNCTPSSFLPLVEGPGAEQPERLASLRWAVLGGEPIPAERLRPWLAHPSCRARILNSYGPTECTDICAAWAFDGATAVSPVPLGRPIDNVFLAVLDEERRPVAGEAEGELWIGGEGVGLGYLGRSELNAERFVTLEICGEPRRMYRTGDRARWRRDDLLEFLGRVDHQVKLRGHRIELGEIEATLLGHPGLREAALIVSGDDGSEGVLVAYVVARPGQEASEADLRRYLAARLPEPMVPTRIVQLAAMPLSPNGKLDRSALPRPTRAAPQPAAQAPLPTEALLMEIWSSILPQAPDRTDRAFFDLGGTSLGAARVQAALRKRLGRDIPIVTLFAHPTITSLARYIDRGDEAAVARIVPARGAQQAQALRRALARARAS